MQLLSYEDLQLRGLGKSPSQHHRNAQNGKFPRPVKCGGRNAFVATEIDAYVHLEMKKRDNPTLRSDLTKWIAAETRAARNPWSVDQIDAWLNKRLGVSK